MYRWGGNDTGAAPVLPANGFPLSDAGAIAVGNSYVAMRDDGTVWTWPHCCTPPAQLEGLQDVVAVSAGNPNSAALKSDGTV